MGSDRGLEESVVESRVRRRLREFRVALSKYSHYSPAQVPRSKALRVEEAELYIIEELRERMAEEASRGRGLTRVLESLKAEGLLHRLIEAAASRLGLAVDPGKVVADIEAGRFDSPEGLVGFIVYQAIARGYAEAVEAAGVKVEGRGAVCPVCGATSDLMVVRPGSTSMVCPFCFYEWRVADGITCPYCGNSDKLSIGVFMDRLRRIGLAHCQACGSSWKVIMAGDLAKAPRAILPLIALAADKFRAYAPPAKAAGDAGEAGG